MKVTDAHWRSSLCKDKNLDRYVNQKCGVKLPDNN